MLVTPAIGTRLGRRIFSRTTEGGPAERAATMETLVATPTARRSSAHGEAELRPRLRQTIRGTRPRRSQEDPLGTEAMEMRDLWCPRFKQWQLISNRLINASLACPEMVSYISCNPESLVANAIELCTPTADEPEKAKGNKGWRKMNSVGLARHWTKLMPKSEPFRQVRVMTVDMFPHTS